MHPHVALAFTVTAIVGCASVSDLDYVTVTPVRFIAVVGKGGPRCQGWCPTTNEYATRFRVEVGSAAFRRLADDAKSRGKDGDLAFLNFAKREVEDRELCARGTAATPQERQPVHTVEGFSVFWAHVYCSERSTDAETGKPLNQPRPNLSVNTDAQRVRAAVRPTLSGRRLPLR